MATSGLGLSFIFCLDSFHQFTPPPVTCFSVPSCHEPSVLLALSLRSVYNTHSVICKGASILLCFIEILWFIMVYNSDGFSCPSFQHHTQHSELTCIPQDCCLNLSRAVAFGHWSVGQGQCAGTEIAPNLCPSS